MGRAKQRKNNRVKPKPALPAQPKKQVNKKWLVLSILIFSFGIFSWYLSSFGYSYSADVRAQFNNVGNVELTYGSPQDTGISPVCGCMKELAYEDWRGVTTVADYLHIESIDESPFTGYFLTGAFPGAISWAPTGFMFKPKFFQIDLPSSIMHEFNPSLLVSGEYPKSWVVTEFSPDNAEQFVLINSVHPLNVSLLGKYPISAYIPTKDSTVKLAHKTGLHVGSANIAEITEQYKQNVVSNTSGIAINQEYPIIDVLGSNVVMWISAYNTIISTGTNNFSLPYSEEHDPANRIFAILIEKPPFSTRIAIKSWAEDEKEKVFSNDLTSINPIGALFSSYIRNEGMVRISIPEPEKQISRYPNLRSDLSKEGIIAIRDISTTLTTFDGEMDAMTFKYPPLQKTLGFGIFGDLEKIKLLNVTGNLWAGTKPIELSAPAELEINNMTFFKSRTGVMSIPYPSYQSNGNSEFTIEKATGKIFLNNTPVFIKADSYRHLFELFQLYSDWLSILSAIIGGIFGLIAFLKPTYKT